MVFEGGLDPWEKPSPPKPKRWWITYKLRAWLIRIKDHLVYQTGLYPSVHYSHHHWHWLDGMLKRESGVNSPWTERWDALFDRWETL